MNDTTLIKNVSLKDFLSDVRTKSELTDCLADKMLSHSKVKKVMVTSGTQTRGNINIPDSLCSHSHEEAGTLIMLHAASVPDEAELVVYTPDTDVLVLLVHMYTQLRESTVLTHGKGETEEENFSQQHIQQSRR